MLAADIHSAKISDSAGARQLLDESLKEDFPNIEIMWADGTYRGPLEKELLARLGWRVVIPSRDNEPLAWTPEGQEPPPRKKGFVVIKWRWIVERTLAWLSRMRRLAKDFEATIESSRAWLHVGMISLMLRRLTT